MTSPPHPETAFPLISISAFSLLPSSRERMPLSGSPFLHNYTTQSLLSFSYVPTLMIFMAHKAVLTLFVKHAQQAGTSWDDDLIPLELCIPFLTGAIKLMWALRGSFIHSPSTFSRVELGYLRQILNHFLSRAILLNPVFSSFAPLTPPSGWGPHSRFECCHTYRDRVGLFWAVWPPSN